MNWKAWLKGLAAVAIGGAATGAAQSVGNGQVNAKTAITAGVGALATALAYLMQSPLITRTAGTAQPAAAPAIDASNTPAGN